ncbi:MAG: 3-dehydroquinate dehydratase [Bacteroidetes bacterium]|nr:3-dehydroquinate dehydratase [Bacteroidota bacterium]MCL6098296.1 3-dehydroquinate dehydratase [Bacteroidota bacterium]
MKILVINGPNLNRLGERDPLLYGGKGWTDIEKEIKGEYPTIDFDFFQSGSEEQVIEKLSLANKNYHGIVFNPGAYSHYSVAIRDAVELLKIPIIEVHLSNISNRDSFRKNLITASKASGYIAGFKENSYLAAVYVLRKIL